MRRGREFRRRLAGLATALLGAALVACQSAGPAATQPDAAPVASDSLTRTTLSESTASQPAAAPAAPAAPPAGPAARPLTTTTVQVPERFRQGAFTTDRQLQLVEGFTISVFALVPGARSMTVAPWGEILVSQPGQGRIVGLQDGDGDGAVDGERTILADLQCPYGMAFRDGYLYVAQTTKVERFPHDGGTAFGPAEQVVTGLPSSGCGPHHYRPLTFDWAGYFYVAFGSSCNVCVEPDPRRGTVWQFTPDGGGREFARGLRNTVDLTMHPVTGEVWGVTNERDLLGDEIPPEPVTAIVEGTDFGWPYCYWNGTAWAVDTNVPRRNPTCAGLTDYYGLPAHTAPLGITFAPLAGLPADLAGSAFVSLHGSWNHSSGVGYRVVRIPFVDGTPQPAEDFVAGWLAGGRGPQGAWGRPVDIQDGLDGALYLSDDRAGAIYRIAPAG